MRKQKSRILTAVFLLLFVLFAASHAFAAEQSSPEAKVDTFFISGSIVDSHKEPVKEAEVKVLINGQPHKLIVEHKEVEATVTSSHGTYQLEFDVPTGTVDTAKIQLALSKTSYRTAYIDFTKEDFAQKGLNFYAVKNQEMPSAIGPAFWIATVVFLIAYAPDLIRPAAQDNCSHARCCHHASAHLHARETRYNPLGLRRRGGVAVRQRVHRLGTAPVRLRRGGRPDRRGHHRLRPVPLLPAARGHRGLRPGDDPLPGVLLPVANSPQALATCAPFLLLRALLGRKPAGDQLLVAPRVPHRFGRVELLDIPGRWGRRDVIGNARGDAQVPR